MCGIVGYIGERDISSILLVGLERLSYRGYDSAGISIVSDGELSCWKRKGKIHHLAETLKPLSIRGNIGIGHTRWATHGEPNETNAHPHTCKHGKIAAVHNGIIENYLELKKSLEKEGYIFRSQTDTEVIPHLIEKYYKGNIEAALRKAITELDGSFAIAVICELEPEKIIIARKGSPIILGKGENENFVSSDINSLVSHTKNIIYLEESQIAIMTQSDITITDLEGNKITPEIHKITWNAQAAEKSGYDHYMLKEIHEQAAVARTIISKYVKNSQIKFQKINSQDQELAKISRFIIQACGTSWHAGLIAKYLIEDYARIPTEVDISSEFRYRQMLQNANEVVIAISQSGETADTLACLREAKSKLFQILSFVNVKGSSIDRESDNVIYTHSGPEIGVASTKNYLAQLLCLYIFTLYLAKLKWNIEESEFKTKLEELSRIPASIESILNQSEKIKKIAEKYHKHKEFIFIGRGLNYPTALEGALKLKEISYIHATGYPAGELKHGPIALIDENLPVICICPKSATYEKMVSNIQEVKARSGKTIIIATEGDTTIKEHADDVIYIPDCPEEHSPILAVIPLQLLSYYIALKLDCDVDQPRNLAKSVTVE